MYVIDQLCGWLFVFNRVATQAFNIQCMLYLTILLLSYMDEHIVSTWKVQALVEVASSAELLSHSASPSSSSVYGHHDEGQILKTRLSKDVISLLSILKGNHFYLMTLVQISSH